MRLFERCQADNCDEPLPERRQVYCSTRCKARAKKARQLANDGVDDSAPQTLVFADMLRAISAVVSGDVLECLIDDQRRFAGLGKGANSRARARKVESKATRFARRREFDT